MSGPEDKAKEIERALADRKDADDALSEKLDGITAAIEALTGSVGDIGSRMDAFESKDADGKDARKDDKDALDHLQEQSDKESEALAKAQLRADSVASAFGMQAPPPMQGEKAHAYRLRLVREHQRNSPEFKDVDLRTLGAGATFDAIESRIYADSAAASARPYVPAGMLHEVKTRDASGRMVSKFHGEPRSWMQQFMTEPQLVERVNKE